MNHLPTPKILTLTINRNPMKNRKLKPFVSLLAVASTFICNAQVGTFQSITVDGSFTDWSTVPLLHADPLDNGAAASVDYGTIYAANDASYFYLRFTLHGTGDPSSFLNNIFIDADNNAATGFNVGGGGHVGSEMLIQSGSGFQEKNGGFNEGGINGLDWLAAPAGAGTDFEMRISRNATYASDSQLVFANNTFSFVLEADATPNEFAPDTGGLVYTFAAVPEPATLSLLGLGALFVVVKAARRRRHSTGTH